MKSSLLFTTAVIAFCIVSSPSSAGSVRVVDGDTLEVSGTTYRLHGIDAPEAGQSCDRRGGGKWACGKAAIAAMEDLVSSGDVVCKGDASDGYGRLIAVCTVNGVDMNRAMVEHGLAWAFVKYSRDYEDVETAARGERIGVWQAETETPWDYRAHKWDVARQASPEGCPIKGNISKQGQIYHAPWSPWYTKTKVTLKDGERWFCSEEEAVTAGWRAPVWGR
jgi:endonuclease YncB( thermonuclease family)